MSEVIFRYVLIAWICMAIAVFIVLFFIVVPYGRYFKSSFGPSLNSKYGWIIMEAFAPLIFVFIFLPNLKAASIAQIVFFALWEIHYIDRAFIYPLTLRISSKRLPISIIITGLLFNIMNAYLNSEYIIVNNIKYSDLWLSDIRFLAGIALFAFGIILNRQSDYILYRIRRYSQLEYSIPRDGFYRWISCPNYLGEMLIWIGWTIATWSPVAAAFSLWTIANLAPRAKSHHRWYRKRFADYPDERHALIPWIW